MDQTAPERTKLLHRYIRRDKWYQYVYSFRNKGGSNTRPNFTLIGEP